MIPIKGRGSLIRGLHYIECLGYRLQVAGVPLSDDERVEELRAASKESHKHQ